MLKSIIAQIKESTLNPRPWIKCLLKTVSRIGVRFVTVLKGPVCTNVELAT